MDFYKNSSDNSTSIKDFCGLTYSTYITIGLGILVQLLTVFGNALVILAILLVKSLRNPRHYLLLSLAIADLLVGMVVIPFKILLNFTCGIWIAGPSWCKAWLSVDIGCCSASVFCLTAIALDRYFAIFYPLKYKVHATFAKSAFAIATTWILAGLSTAPHFIFFEESPGLTATDTFEQVCSTGSHSSWSALVQLLLPFFMPMGIILVIYGKIMMVISNKNFLSRKTPGKASVNDDEVVSGNDEKERQACLQGRVSEFVQEYKGCIIVGAIMLVFVLCWLPFFTLMLGVTISDLLGKQLSCPEWLYELFIWLGYSNSCTNPLIYTMINKEFRQAFRDIVTCKCSSMRTRSRHGRYLQQIGSRSTRSNTSGS